MQRYKGVSDIINETEELAPEENELSVAEATDAVNDATATESVAEDNGIAQNDAVDYEALIASDVMALKAEFPELGGISDITELNNPLRYAALRDMGLTPAEAYLATAKRVTKDTRSHLRSAHGRSAAASSSVMSQIELATARELFPGKSDTELQRLYKKVTK